MTTVQTKEQLLKRQSDQLLKLAEYGFIIEEPAFYSIESLRSDVEKWEKMIQKFESV